MVLISFSVSKEKVRSGSKNMTIRKLRKYPVKVGDELQLYWKSRTKESEKLREKPCLFETKLTWEQIVLLEYRNALARLDGFRDWYAMSDWFYSTHEDLNSKTKLQIVCWEENTAKKLKKILEAKP